MRNLALHFCDRFAWVCLAWVVISPPSATAGCVGGTCADGYTGCGCDIACCERRIRGDQSSNSSYTAPDYDYGAAQRAQEEANRKAEAEHQAREQEAKRQAAEKQRKFIEERDQSVGLLKGNSGNSGVGAFGLKGVDQADSGLRQADRQVNRDLGGKLAAWKQLHCASSIIGSALIALKSDDGHEFSYLAGEANKALNGESLGVECAAAPPLPNVNGRKVDLEKVRKTEQRILERAKKIAERLPPKPAALPEQKASPLPASEDELARLRRQQAEINRVQQRKYDPASQEAINREQRAKKELTQLILENKKIETGDFSISLVEETATGKTPYVSANTKKTAP